MKSVRMLFVAIATILVVPAVTMADCVRSDIIEERNIDTTFRAADHNSVTSTFDLRPTFARLCITGSDPDEKSDTDFILFEIDTYGGSGYTRFAVNEGSAPILLDALNTFTRWHAIATERGDALERDIQVDSESSCRTVEWVEAHPQSALAQYLNRMRGDCTADRANGYGRAYVYFHDKFVVELRRGTRTTNVATITADQVPELIRLAEAFISRAVYSTTVSAEELDTIYE